MRRIFMTLPALCLAAGCVVSKGTYLQKEAELAACVEGKATSDKATETCLQDLDARGKELEAARLRHLDDRRAFDACQAEREAVQGRLAAAQGAAAEAQGARLQEAAAGEAAAKAEADLDAARRDLEGARGEARGARQEAEAAKAEVEALKAREAELKARLEKELQERTVEIENLKARLSVRVVDRILFDTGRTEIKREGKAVLDKVAEVIGKTAERVRVEGHTDDVPVSRRLKAKFTSNWELSAARAANVVRYFQHGKGIDPARMEAVGLGPYRPDAPNDSFEGRAQNRRVVIVLTAPAAAASR